MSLELFWIIFGALVGWIAYILQANQQVRQLAIYVITGMIGAMFGGACSHLLGVGGIESDTGVTSFMFAIFGASVLTFLTTYAHKRTE